MSTSMPRSCSGPVSDSGARPPTTQPIRCRCDTSSMSPWRVASRSRPGSVTVVPVNAALARKYDAVETSGSISSSVARYDPGATDSDAVAALHLDPERAHHVDGQLQVRRRDERAEAQRRRRARERRRHQQAAEELAGDRRVDVHRPAPEPGRGHGQRQRLAVDQRPLGPQRGQHRPERPAAQLRVGVDREPARAGGEHRHDEPSDGARHAAVDVGVAGRRAADAVDHQVGPVRPVDGRDARAQRPQHPGHHLGVVGDQRADQAAAALGDPGQQQRPVGQAL